MNVSEKLLQNILKTYLKRLTNLTSRNRSLLLLNLPKEQFIDLHELDFLESKPSFHIIEQLIANKKQIPLCEVLDARFEKNNLISKQLRKIARNEAFIEEERGAKDLYVGYPIVKGKLSDGTAIRCPLLFFPVTLIQKNNKWILQNRKETIAFNRSFLLAYSHFNQVAISDEFIETSFEDFSKESLVFRTELYEFLKESILKINFNQELFTSQISHFERLTKADLDLTERNGELKLYPQAVLGIFPQAGSYLVPDYDFLIEASQPPEGEYMEGFFDKRVLPLGAGGLGLDVFSTDSSQEYAIQQVRAGKSIVVQGPPGTGKSQLICNLITDFTSHGKRVLLVSQKRTALDTVFKRLQEIKMSDFVGLVHDFKNDRSELFEKIANQIEKIEDFQKQNKGLDAILLERKFTQSSRRIEQIVRELADLKHALFDESICGVSVKDLYLSSNPNSEYFELGDLLKSFKINELYDFKRRFKQYQEYQNKLRQSEGFEFWMKRVSFSKFDFSNQKNIIQAIEDIEKNRLNFESFFDKINLKSQFRELFWQKLLDYSKYCTKNNITTYTEIIESINNSKSNVKEENLDLINFIIFSEYIEKKELIKLIEYSIKNKITFKTSELESVYQKLSEIYANNGVEINTKTDELELRKTQVNQALIASQNPVKWLFWKLFDKDRGLVRTLLLSNKLNLKTDDLQILSSRINNRIEFEKIAKKFKKQGVVINADENWEDIEKTLKNHILVSKAIEIYHESALLKSSDLIESKLYELASISKDLIQFIEFFYQSYSNLKSFISDSQILDLLKQKFGKSLIINVLRADFDLFVAADQVKESFKKDEMSIVLNEKNDWEVIENSIKLAWIQEIEERYPILRGVSNLKIKQLEDELQECIRTKQELSQEILLIKLREQTYKGLIINRLQNVVSYRELNHQVSKKRKLWSIRRIIETYQEEVFKLIPCWMASPESVSALFPMSQSFFDLVIFDEASQCYAENGIPAIYRGKQVVIAGDSKQLQPNDLYQIRYEDSTEDEPILEIDSLLDLASHYLPQVQLKGHYRSKSLDLIDFSNQYFYKNTLSLIPDYQLFIKKYPAIQYIKVNGFWEQNSNPVEAQKVFEIITDLQKKYPEKTIGVVTFNYKQAELIDAENLKNVAVKNIENIQGDEFDIVIFSIGYAPDLKGRMVMNFGTLNQQGGENRLNVAITRAKEKVIVVSSIYPEQLNVENAQNVGPKLLKKYLEYALGVSQGEYHPTPYQTQQSSKNTENLKLSKQLIGYNQLYINELPFADITIKNKDESQSLILTDDDLYFDSLNPKDSHAYLPMILKQKGWVFERIWSREYWRSR